MKTVRKVEIFSAGCAVCEEAIQMVRNLACPSCELSVLDMRSPAVTERARSFGIRSVPAVVVESRLSDCCSRGIDPEALRRLGVGKSGLD
ncbi:MAG: hypothetical protein L0191_14600 [Acidobacteria bacterium]|nr:hypothetical protein [Acidobacteriota bacterium]